MQEFLLENRARVWCLALVGLALLLGALEGSALSAQTLSRKARCLDASYDYRLSMPAGVTARPAIVLLHGAGGTSAEMMDVWGPVATREHIVLIAPQLPRTRDFEELAPAVLRCVADDARRAAAVDSTRIYLFGYSMGGYLAFDAAMLASRYFAGAGVYAAAIADEFYPILGRADRRIPMALYIGTRDQFYPTAQVARTRDSLAAHGFPVHFVELAGQDHRLDNVADSVTADAWRFLSAYRLGAP